MRKTLLIFIFVMFVPFSLALNPNFIRGDSSGDGILDITDAIETLKYLFSGGVLSCLDSADSNDDGILDISDPIVTLDFLFLGKEKPTESFGRRGVDCVNKDNLGCRTFTDSQCDNFQVCKQGSISSSVEEMGECICGNFVGSKEENRGYCCWDGDGMTYREERCEYSPYTEKSIVEEGLQEDIFLCLNKPECKAIRMTISKAEDAHPIFSEGVLVWHRYEPRPLDGKGIARIYGCRIDGSIDGIDCESNKFLVSDENKYSLNPSIFRELIIWETKGEVYYDKTYGWKWKEHGGIFGCMLNGEKCEPSLIISKEDSEWIDNQADVHSYSNPVLKQSPNGPILFWTRKEKIEDTMKLYGCEIIIDEKVRCKEIKELSESIQGILGPDVNKETGTIIFAQKKYGEYEIKYGKVENLQDLRLKTDYLLEINSDEVKLLREPKIFSKKDIDNWFREFAVMKILDRRENLIFVIELGGKTEIYRVISSDFISSHGPNLYCNKDSCWIEDIMLGPLTGEGKVDSWNNFEHKSFSCSLDPLGKISLYSDLWPRCLKRIRPA